MKFRFSGPMWLIAASLLVVVFISGLAQSLTTGLLEKSHEGDYQLMRQVLASVQKSNEDRALNRADLVASMPAVRNAFIARDRPRLLGECQKMFALQEQKYGLDQAQFHVPMGVSFLRLHKPEAFGDDQTTYRPMLADVHQNKLLRKGVALTKGGPAVFGIVPIIDESGKFAGSFEMGLELAPMLNKIKDAYGLEVAVYFEEKQLKEISTDLPPDTYQPKNRVGKYIRFHATNTELASALVSDKDVEITDPRNYERTVGKAPWGVQLLPLYNYSNKQIGVVALASNFEDEKKEARRAQIYVALASLVAIAMLVGIILLVLRNVLIAPLAAINERMTALSSGDASRPAPPLDSYCEELETLATNYERLRSQMAPPPPAPSAAPPPYNPSGPPPPPFTPSAPPGLTGPPPPPDWPR